MSLRNRIVDSVSALVLSNRKVNSDCCVGGGVNYVTVGRIIDLPFIPKVTERAHKCPHPQCAACHMSKAHNRTPDTQTMQRTSEMSIRAGDLNPGDCISCDQWTSNTLGRRPETYGKEPPSEKFTGGMF